ncbi:MAG: CHAT domain-containing protein, partial [Saprospiraceae bacterium]|nr:CHAT domain-containing protein [Saprospiraceae bacterium]MCB0684162.1 CHAT domain-containing protein [Saprospiraceae bacterium]
LAPLAGNKQEVLDIAGLLGGDYFLDGQADRESFERSARQYQIVHLATHACVNSADPLYNQIFFSDDQYLYTFDIYNLNLNADLIVLSACETGLGKVVEGEGVMNLARGFAYAGCPSIVMSLWAVSDQASSTLMLEYYRRLLEGESKTAALQQAQLSYLQNQIPSKMHPSYWAPFVQVGDPSAMRWDSKKNGWSWYWVLAALPLLWLAWRQTRKSGLRSV